MPSYSGSRRALPSRSACSIARQVSARSAVISSLPCLVRVKARVSVSVRRKGLGLGLGLGVDVGVGVGVGLGVGLGVGVGVGLDEVRRARPPRSATGRAPRARRAVLAAGLQRELLGPWSTVGRGGCGTPSPTRARASASSSNRRTRAADAPGCAAGSRARARSRDIGAGHDALRHRLREGLAHLGLGLLAAVDVRSVDHPVARVQRREHGLPRLGGSQLVGTKAQPRHQHGCR
eukprot:scaffold109938_cov66-Phaeocystis_antarctica.AAC.1